MKLRSLSALAALSALVLASNPLFAAEVDQASGLTRAEVHRSVLAARAAGQLQFGDTAYPPVAASLPSTETRGMVRQDAVQAARATPSGEIGADVVAWDEVGKPSSLTRAAVRREVLAARKDGTLPGPGDAVDYPEQRIASVATKGTAPSGLAAWLQMHRSARASSAD